MGSDEEIIFSDEYIIDTLYHQVLHSKKPFENGFPHQGKRIFKNMYTLDDALREKDIELLEEYAPRLFNTYKGEYELEDIMIEWATLLHNYRTEHRNKNIIHSMGGKQIIPTYAKKSKDEKVTILKKRVEDILKLLSTNFSTKEHISEFTDILKKVYANPDDYFTYKPKYQIKKQPIKDFLISLELKGKSKEINDFMKAMEAKKRETND